jgi:hypothetical protein
MRVLKTVYGDKPSTLLCQGESVEVRATQIIVWVSLSDTLRTFPAVL